jgi:hypothetical protein
MVARAVMDQISADDRVAGQDRIDPLEELFG